MKSGRNSPVRFALFGFGAWGSHHARAMICFCDLARWYFSGSGDPVSVFARARANRLERPELQDNFSALANFPRGGYAVIAQTLSAFEHHQVVKITGTLDALCATARSSAEETNPE